MANNISNPAGAGKTLDFKAFENLAKNQAIDGQATIGIATDSNGRSIIGLSANVGGKKVQQLAKPDGDLSKISPEQRNGVLATQAFKQALVQRYGESIANAVDKHLVKSGHARILTADDVRKNLKVAAAIVKILRQQANTAPSTAHSAAQKASQLSQRSTRRQEDGSPVPSAPPRSRSSSANTEAVPSAPPRSRANTENLAGSGDEVFDHLEPKGGQDSLETLGPGLDINGQPLQGFKENPLFVKPTAVQDVFDHLEPKPSEEIFDHLEPQTDINGEALQWVKDNPLYVKTETAFEIAGDSAHLIDDKGNQIAEQRPRAKALSEAELNDTLKTATPKPKP